MNNLVDLLACLRRLPDAMVISEDDVNWKVVAMEDVALQEWGEFRVRQGLSLLADVGLVRVTGPNTVLVRQP